MRPPDEMVIEWLRRAEDDLRLAELALGASPPVCWGAAFHAEQAAEKWLKAVLTFRGVEFERTHDIDYLLELCVGVEPGAERLRGRATQLTDFAVEARYPFPRREATEAESREALEIAREVGRFVRSVLPGELCKEADRR